MSGLGTMTAAPAAAATTPPAAAATSAPAAVKSAAKVTYAFASVNGLHFVATVAGEKPDLTRKFGIEFDLLAFLLAHPGIVMTRERLLERVWGLSFPGGTRTVDVHVAQLRRKLDRPDLIKTVRGSGYKAAV